MLKPDASGAVSALRQGLVAAAAAAAIYVLTPSTVVTQGLPDFCDDVLFAVNSNMMWDLANFTASNPRQFNDGGPGSSAFEVDLAPDGSHYGFIGGVGIGLDPLHWGRIDPAVTDLNPGNGTSPGYTSLQPFTPAAATALGRPLVFSFVKTFQAGQPMGYRFNKLQPGANANPVRLHAIASISPFRENLVYADIGLAFTNTGLGSVVKKDGTKAWYFTTDAVYELNLTTGPPATQIGSLSLFNISANATVTGSSQDGIAYIADAGTIYSVVMSSDPSLAFVFDAWPAPPLTQIVDLGRYPCVPGGVRIEPHAELVTTESGGAATFTAVLTAVPAAEVTVNFESTDGTEGTVAPASVTFNPGNWNVARTITVTGVPDSDTANQPYRITTSSVSADPRFHDRPILDVDVTNTHVNQAPVLTPASPSMLQGSPVVQTPLGVASDLESAASSLNVTAITVPSGVSVGTIGNANGTISAPLGASCTAATGNRTLTLRVTDPHTGVTDQDVTISVGANTAPSIGSYAATGVSPGSGISVAASAPPADNGSIASVVAASSAGFTGGLSVNQATGEVTITNASPSGIHTITVTVTDNCGTTTDRTFDLSVGCQAISLDTSEATFSIGGGSGSANVTALTGCDWTASTPAPWIVLGTASGSGNGLLTYTVDENRTGASRNASITIAEQSIDVTQLTAFADATLTPGTSPIRELHVRELRLRVDVLRQRLMLPAVVWTDPALSAATTPVRAAHLIELRTAVREAYESVGATAPSFTDPDLTAGATIARVAHVIELRAAIETLENALPQ